jgi:hypothetical protein
MLQMNSGLQYLILYSSVSSGSSTGPCQVDLEVVGKSFVCPRSSSTIDQTAPSAHKLSSSAPLTHQGSASEVIQEESCSSIGRDSKAERPSKSFKLQIEFVGWISFRSLAFLFCR